MHIWRIICITIIIIINFYPDIKIHTQNRTHEMKSHETQNEAVNVNMQAKRNKFSLSHSLSTWPSLPKYCINNKCCCCCFFCCCCRFCYFLACPSSLRRRFSLLLLHVTLIEYDTAFICNADICVGTTYGACFPFPLSVC